MTGEKYDYMYILNLSDYSTLPDLKEVWVSKEWQGVNDWRKSVTISFFTSDYSSTALHIWEVWN